MSKRNRKTRAQKRVARLVETLRRKGSIAQDVGAVDPEKTKYLLLSEVRNGAVGPVRRIVAVRPGPWGPIGTTGGFIEADSNLSHEGDCWVYDEAEVSENARVTDNAQVRDDTLVWGSARIRDNARVRGGRNRRSTMGNGEKYEAIQHPRSGEEYACRVDAAGVIVAASGPLYPDDPRDPQALADMVVQDVGDVAADGEWLQDVFDQIAEQ